jgi:S-adenosylmethionine uptake transporter
MTPSRQGDLTGGAWLIADMALNIWALTIVKALGLGYPSAQIVFLRAAVGLVLILPWVWRGRAAFAGLSDLRLHGLRVALSALTLTLSFHAVARMPFALFTAVNFTRPLVLMALAAMLLGETIGRRRWTAAGLALLGVLIAVDPAGGGASLPALAALAGAVLAGSAAIIVTRRLSAAPVVVLMTFYTAGLAVLSAPVALAAWQPVAPQHLAPLLAVGLFAQTAQACFLRAHASARAGFLAVLGYLSLVLSAAVGWLVFAELPTPRFLAGAALVVGAALWVTLERR